jgi:hypothetical protein
MRLTPLVLLLAACAPEEPPPAAAESAIYAGAGRDRLCVDGERVGFITFGDGDANCSVRGRLESAGDGRLAIIPNGDEDCRIEAADETGRILLGSRKAGCAYYCGPNADFAGKAFTKQDSASPAVDFAGDPLC